MDAVLHPTSGGAVASLTERRFGWLAAAIAIGCALITLRAGRAAGFVDDDIANLALGKRYGFGVETFFGLPETRDHLQPGSAALSKLVSVLGPHWLVAQLLAASLVGLLVFTVAFLVRRITDAPALSLGVAFAAGTSIVVGRIALWWTATSLNLPMLLAAALVIFLALCWWRSGSVWLLVACVGAQLAAESFSDRAVLVPLVVWAVLLLDDSRATIRGNRLWRRTLSAAPLLVPLFAVALVHVSLTLKLAGTTASPEITAALGAPLGDWVSGLGNWWARGVAGVLVNDIEPPPGLGGEVSVLAPHALRIMAGGILVLAVLLFFSLRNRYAALAWVAIAAIVSLSWFQLAVGRISTQGPVGLAGVPRYQDVTLLVILVMVPLAWTISGRPRVGLRPTVGAGVVVLVALAWLFQLRAGIRGALERPMAAALYADNLQRSISRLGSSPGRFTILDERVPDSVMFRVPQTGSFSWLSTAIGILAPGLPKQSFGDLGSTPVKVGQDGTALPVRLSAVRSLGAGKRCVATSPNSLWLGGSRRVVIPVSRRAAESGLPLVLTVRLTEGSQRGQVGVMSLRPGSSLLPTQVVELAQSPGGFRALLEPGTPEAGLDFWGGARTCVVAASTAVVASP